MDTIIANVINLDKRQDRYENIISDFQTINSIQLKRFSAIEHNKGSIGCCMSHQKILKENKHLRKNILIIEDDCKIVNKDTFDNEWTKIKEWLDGHDDIWDIFVGGSSFIQDDNIILINNDLGLTCSTIYGTTHFIYYNYNFIDKVLACNPHTKKFAIDKLYKFYPNMRTVIPIDYIAIQKTDYSDIEHKTVDYDKYFTNSQLKLKEYNYI